MCGKLCAIEIVKKYLKKDNNRWQYPENCYFYGRK
jgi:hypothetical protein